MASNGSATTIGNGSRLTLTLVIVLISALAGCGGFIWSQAAAVQAHTCNADIHHTTSALDGTYARGTEVQQGFKALDGRLRRIEDKLDRLQ